MASAKSCGIAGAPPVERPPLCYLFPTSGERTWWCRDRAGLRLQQGLC